MTDDILYKDGIPWQHTAVADEAREIMKGQDHMEYMEDIYHPTYVPSNSPSGSNQGVER